MFSGSFEEIIQRLFLLVVFFFLMIGLFFLVFLVKIKNNKSDYFSTIRMTQKLLSFNLSIFIWGVFAIHVGLILWLLLFFILRNIVFKKNAKRLQELYQNYQSCKNGYPLVKNMTQWKQAFFQPLDSTKPGRQFKYQFRDHMNSSAPLLIFSFLELVSFSNNTTVYIVEFLIVATAGYVFLGQIVYHLSLNAPSSLFYLSPGLSYIPVVFIGIVYYAVAIIMLSTIVAQGTEMCVPLELN